MLKIVILLITLLFCLFSLNAQEKSNLKLGIEPGFLVLTDSENIGLFLNLEPKLKVHKNTFIGLRIGVALNSQKFENYGRSQFYIDEQADNGGFSVVPTIEYYLNEDNIRPFIAWA